VPGRPERNGGFDAHPNERDDLQPDNAVRNVRQWHCCRGSHEASAMILMIRR